MTVKASYLVDIGGLTFSEDQPTSTWVHALTHGAFKHPLFGTIDITSDRVKGFVESVKNKVRGIDPSINYMHEGDGEAAGWVKDAQARSDGLWVLVEWTTDAVRKIKDKAFRYFSTEFFDEWEDSAGTKHKDVFFGGALTNRPFMKNLVPINLSELTTVNAFELVAAVTGKDIDSLKGGSNMPLSDDDLKKIVDGVATKLSETKTQTPPNPQPMNLEDIPELKALAEENPMVRTLLAHVQTQNLDLEQTQRRLKEEEIERRLAEFDRTKIVLTPVARERVFALLKKMPTELSEDFWALLNDMKKSSSFLVELGERAGATVNYGNPKSALQQFSEAVSLYQKANNANYADAVEAVTRDNPALYNNYRRELVNTNG